MHYRHSFHAGNFADVFKHIVLGTLLSALGRKDKPWSYLETHSGAAAYDLDNAGAVRTGEWRNGIGRLYGLAQAPPALTDYLSRIRQFNSGGELRRYPGSPWLALQAARPDDRIVLCEKIEPVFAELKQNLGGDSRVSFHRRNGYEAPALLPPKEKRGLVLVDPPFERPDEFEAMAQVLAETHRRFSGGTVALWYPLKNRHAAARFVRQAARTAGECLQIEFENGAAGDGQMRGCGMLVAKPPFRLEDELAPALKILVRDLAQGPKAEFRILTPSA